MAFFSILKCRPRWLQLLRLIKSTNWTWLNPNTSFFSYSLNQLSLSPRQPLERFLFASLLLLLLYSLEFFHVGVLSMWPNRAWLFPLRPTAAAANEIGREHYLLSEVLHILLGILLLYFILYCMHTYIVVHAMWHCNAMELNRRGNNYSHASAVVAQINNVVVHVGHIHNHVKAVIRQLELSIFFYSWQFWT